MVSDDYGDVRRLMKIFGRKRKEKEMLREE